MSYKVVGIDGYAATADYVLRRKGAMGVMGQSLNGAAEPRRILEGVVTTLDASGAVNLSPMGPLVDPRMEHFALRPFRTSTTYRNLKSAGQGVFHVTDDVELIAQAALGQPDPLPAMAKLRSIAGMRLQDACRWYAFEVVSLDDSEERVWIEVRVVEQGRVRDFFGFNRAMHAVIEAAILATRVHMLPAEEIASELVRLTPLVEKTGGEKERRAFELLQRFIQQQSTER